ncbi:MAG: hypothetical protein HZA78_11365 [Candidatus Schekmanbacteria bacterium]|nr:hypothetical protein [Candidatus Schekmanbacteria bacterium]
MERAESIENHNCRANALKFSPEGLGLRTVLQCSYLIYQVQPVVPDKSGNYKINCDIVF